jgi:hypothetical protein
VAALDDAELETVDRFLAALLDEEPAPGIDAGPAGQSSSTRATSPTPRTMPSEVSAASTRRSGST